MAAVGLCGCGVGGGGPGPGLLLLPPSSRKRRPTRASVKVWGPGISPVCGCEFVPVASL